MAPFDVTGGAVAGFTALHAACGSAMRDVFELSDNRWSRVAYPPHVQDFTETPIKARTVADLHAALLLLSGNPAAAVALSAPTAVLPVEVLPRSPVPYLEIRDKLLPESFHGAACVVQEVQGRQRRVRFWFLTDSAVSADHVQAMLTKDGFTHVDRSVYAPGVILQTCAPEFLGGADPVAERWHVLEGHDRVRIKVQSDLIDSVFGDLDASTVTPAPFKATGVHPSVLRKVAAIGAAGFNTPLIETAEAIRLCHPESDWPMCRRLVVDAVKATGRKQREIDGHIRAFNMHLGQITRPGLPTMSADDVGAAVRESVLTYAKGAASIEAQTEPPAPSLISADTGTGKSHQTRVVAKRMIAEDSQWRVLVTVPDHKLSGEYERALLAEIPGQIGVRKGPERPTLDDPSVAMCLRASVNESEASDLKTVLNAGGRLSDLCGGKQGRCEFHPANAGKHGCEYIAQQLGTRNIVAMAGAVGLQRALPADVQRTGALADFDHADFDLHVIDEFAAADQVKIMRAVPLGELLHDLSSTAKRALSRDKSLNITLPDAVEWATAQLTLAKLDSVLRNISVVDARNPMVFDFEVEGLTVAMLRDALAVVNKHRIPVTPSDSAHRLQGQDLRDALWHKAHCNGRVRQLAGVLRAAIQGLQAMQNGGERFEPIAHLRVRNRMKGDQPISEVIPGWRADIHPANLGMPTLIMDATANPNLMANVFPNLTHGLDARATDGDGVFRVQVRDFTGSMAALIPAKEARPTAESVARQRALGVITRLFQLCGPVGLIQPKAAQEWLQEHAPLPDDVIAGHFGAIRGQNAYEAVRALIVAGRLRPSARDVEDMASILTGRAVAQVEPDHSKPAILPKRPEYFLMRDGSYAPAGLVEYHPDGVAQAVLQSVRDAELYQAMERGRSVRRSEAQPLHVLIYSNVPLGRAVDLVVTEQDVLAAGSWLSELLIAGVWPIGRGRHKLAETALKASRLLKIVSLRGDSILSANAMKVQLQPRKANPAISIAKGRLLDTVDQAFQSRSKQVHVLGLPIPLEGWAPVNVRLPGQHGGKAYVRGGVTAAAALFPDAEISGGG